MQIFEALFITLALFATGLLLRQAFAPHAPRLPSLAVLLALAVAGGVLDYGLGPREYAREFRPLRSASLQFVDFGDHSLFAGQRGLLVVPSWLPLPSITGSLAALAPAGARFQTQWEGEVLHVSVTDAAGHAIDLICHNQRANRATIVSGPKGVANCPQGGDLNRH
ncbi:hypothetical protein [Niveibacterium sp. SC-1]|uniref:hypothetical protein n=1 Tax=Niveibacterium sp. SC-1 TaxID=3135646 RepID=UPI00311F6BCF